MTFKMSPELSPTSFPTLFLAAPSPCTPSHIYLLGLPCCSHVMAFAPVVPSTWTGFPPSLHGWPLWFIRPQLNSTPWGSLSDHPH